MKKLHISALFIICSIIISGCSSAEETIYEIIESTAVKEELFEEQQDPMKELEASEKAIYDEIMKLGLKQQDEISPLADKALANLDQREEHMKKEKKSLETSKQEFEKIKEQINNIKDQQLKKEAEQLQTIMDERFASYDHLYTAYMNGLSEDRKIYEMLKNEALKMEDLYAQIEKSNQVYEEVRELNNVFNEKTEQFNDKKINFYKKAGINIETTS